MNLVISILVYLTFIPNYSSSGEELLGRLQQKFKSIDDLSVEFEQSQNGSAEVKGKFFYKKEDKLRIEYNNAVLISDGVTNWSYNKKNNKLIISDNQNGEASPFSLKKLVYDYPKECEVNSELENNLEVLVLKPKSGSSIGYSEIKIWVGKENLIDRIVFKDNADNLINIIFSKYKVNRKIADNLFNLTPPEGSKVIDLR